MKATTLLRLFLCLSTLAGALPAAAQASADREIAAPRVNASNAEPTSAEQHRDLILHTLTNTLRLQPYQTLVLRRALTADLIPAGPTEILVAELGFAPAEELRLLLSEMQLNRLNQWKQREPSGQQLSLIALSR